MWMPRTWVAKRCSEQEGLDLEGARVAAAALEEEGGAEDTEGEAEGVMGSKYMEQCSI